MDARERALSGIREVLARKPPPAQGFAEVARALQALPRHTGVYLYALRGAHLELVAHAGRDTEHVRIPVGSGICGLSARTHRTVVVDDVRADPRYLACNLETRSEIVVPVMRGDRYLAQIDVDSDLEAAFGPEDRAFLERVAPLLEPLFP
jgi:GAF domain-containing protein